MSQSAAYAPKASSHLATLQTLLFVSSWSGIQLWILTQTIELCNYEWPRGIQNICWKFYTTAVTHQDSHIFYSYVYWYLYRNTGYHKKKTPVSNSHKQLYLYQNKVMKWTKPYPLVMRQILYIKSRGSKLPVKKNTVEIYMQMPRLISVRMKMYEDSIKIIIVLSINCGVKFHHIIMKDLETDMQWQNWYHIRKSRLSLCLIPGTLCSTYESKRCINTHEEIAISITQI